MNRRWWPWAAIIGILAAVAGSEFALGRVPICTCGYVSLWHGDVWSSGNSQHLTDWYTLSHLAHGFLFYAALRWLLPGWTRAVARGGGDAARRRVGGAGEHRRSSSTATAR